MDKIWYTEYPPAGAKFSAPFEQTDQQLKKRNFSKAYVSLQVLERGKPENDTLRYLKGYCLLEMGEGAEALRYFKDLDENQPAWKARVEWYRGLAYLLAGRKPEAVAVFKEIAGNAKDPFRQQAEKALKLLE